MTPVPSAPASPPTGQTDPPPGRAPVAPSAHPELRERILQAAHELAVEGGWASVTMAAVAARVGVVRQTVYNDIGGKTQLGQALVRRAVDRFYLEIGEQLLAAPTAADAIEAAIRHALSAAAQDPVLRDVVTASHSGQSTLVPAEMTQGQVAAERAADRLVTLVSARPDVADLPREGLRTTSDQIVRLVISHVVRPGGSPDDVAAEVRRLVCQPEVSL